MPSSVGDAQEAEPCSELALPSTISADSVLRDTIFFHAGFYEHLGHPHHLVMLRQACKAFAAQAQPMTFSPSSNRAAQASWWSSWHPFGVRALLSAAVEAANSASIIAVLEYAHKDFAMSAEVALEGVHGLVRIIVSICQEEAPPPLAQPPAQPMSPVLAAVREAAMLFLQSEERGRDMQPMMQALIRICHHEGAVATCIKTMRVCAHEPVLLTQCCRLLMLASRSEVCKSLIVAKGGISAIVAALKHHQAFAKLQEFGLGTLRNICCTATDLQRELVRHGGVEVIQNALRLHSEHLMLQIYGIGCLLCIPVDLGPPHDFGGTEDRTYQVAAENDVIIVNSASITSGSALGPWPAGEEEVEARETNNAVGSPSVLLQPVNAASFWNQDSMSDDEMPALVESSSDEEYEVRQRPNIDTLDAHSAQHLAASALDAASPFLRTVIDEILDDEEDYDSDEDDVPHLEEHILLPAEISKAAERG